MADTPKIERLKGGKVVFTVTPAPEEAKGAMDAALQRLSSRVNVKGFRPGHAPKDMVEGRIDPDALFEETVREVLKTKLGALVQEHKLQPIIPPTAEAVSRDPLTIKITFVEKPPVTMKKKDALAPQKKEIAVDPKDIDRVVQSALAEHRTYASVDRAAAKGDRITVNFAAKDKDGAEIKGLSAENERVVIGESRLLPGFEDALVGMKAGEDKTFTLTLPEKFPVPALQKAPATFAAKALSVESVMTPPFDDDFAKKHLGQQSSKEFRDMVEKTLKSQEEQFSRMSRERQLLDAIREHAQVELADELVDRELRSLVEEWAARLEQQGLTVEDALKKEGKTAKQLEEELRKEAVNRWKLRFGIAHLIEERKTSLTEDEEKQAIDAFLEQTGETERPEAERRIAAKDPLYDEVRWRALVDKLIGELLA